MAYELAGTRAEQERTLHYLEWREKQYDIRRRVDVFASAGDAAPAVRDALVYIAGPDEGPNPDYIGPAPLTDIARVIATAVGPSGPNHIYLLRLAEALRRVGCWEEVEGGLDCAIEYVSRILGGIILDTIMPVTISSPYSYAA